MTFRVGFINVPGHPEAVLTVSPPAGILSMAAVARNGGIEPLFLDADVMRLEPSDVVRALRKAVPDLVGFSLNVSQVASAGRYMDAVRRAFPGAPIVVGGPYVTGRDAAIFDDFPALTFAVVGEGEHALLDLAEHVQGRKPLEDVRNLLARSGDGILRNPTERIPDLDALPLPEYALVGGGLGAYPGAFPSIASPTMAILCARGCPFECTFCSSPMTWGRRVTFRSPDSIVKELRFLAGSFGVREVFFQDDTLNVKPDWFRDLCGRIRSENLHEKMTFKAPFKAGSKRLDRSLLEDARRTNFWMIYFGVESGSPELLRRMKKKVTVEEIEKAFLMTHEAGLCTYASFMVGNPGETRETVEQSLALAERIRPDYGGFAVAAPFPGSELYESARERGHIMKDGFRDYRFGECILRTDALSCEEIASIASAANHRLDRITGRAPEGEGADRRARFRRRVAGRYGILGHVARFGIRGLIRRYGLWGLTVRGARQILRGFRIGDESR
ncbi:MAG: B12-binding domain-containing radical SAM protein [Planctomycetota bacterium]|jgi:radical SAM superfamily enzyme YgiQ (UPF0313 family)